MDEAVRIAHAELAALTVRFEEATRETKTLQDSLDDTSRQMITAKESHDSASAVLKKRALEAEGRADSLGIQLQELQKDMVSASERADVQQRKLDSSQKEAEDARVERERMRKRVLELEGEVEQTKLLSTETAQESSQAFEAEKKAWDEEKIAMQKRGKSHCRC